MTTILVAAALIFEDGKVLLTQRKAGAHLAGAWEFPGGKVEAEEDPRQAVERELREELGIDARAGDIVEATFHRYEEAQKTVLLLFYEVRRMESSPPPRALDVAAYRWATRDDLDRLAFPAADGPVLAKVRDRLTLGLEHRVGHLVGGDLGEQDAVPVVPRGEEEPRER